MRERCRELVETGWFQWAVIAAILVNAVAIGFETSETWMAEHGTVTLAVGRVTLAIFIVELALRLTAYGWAFFRNAWNVFDFVVVAVALIPAGQSSGVLRILRILRVMRLLSTVRSMRMVAGALVATVPGLISISAVLGMLLYISAVTATQLFGGIDPERYGDLGAATLTMFQVMTGDDWGNIVRPVVDVQPWAWVFFLTYIVLASYIVLNLFIAVAVEALDRQKEQDAEPAPTPVDGAEVIRAIGDLRDQITALERRLDGPRSPAP